uniref:LOB domain-containing protein 18 n=2 Tax=Cajanus cajan TaxID=3821 RepID=A0A151TBP5_CAJCA|nr:LOB domain-containing protein 18 [Cajanus cajan]
MAPPVVSVAELPSLTTYDLSTLFDPMAQTPSWALQPNRPIDSRQYMGSSGTSTTTSASASGGDLQALACELLHRHGSSPLACSNPSSSHNISK